MSYSWSNDVQRSFYNGLKSIHSLKQQTVDNALGFTIDVFGLVSLRCNDMAQRFICAWKISVTGVYLKTRLIEIILESIRMDVDFNEEMSTVS